MCIYYFIYYSSQPHEVHDIMDSFQMKKIKARRSSLLIYSFTASSLQSRDLRLYLLSIKKNQQMKGDWKSKQNNLINKGSFEVLYDKDSLSRVYSDWSALSWSKLGIKQLWNQTGLGTNSCSTTFWKCDLGQNSLTSLSLRLPCTVRWIDELRHVKFAVQCLHLIGKQVSVL